MNDEVHIASLVVRHRPDAGPRLEAWVGKCPALEIAGRDGACSILLYEGSGTRELMELIEDCQATPGVVSVNLIYHHAEPRDALEQPASPLEHTGASDGLAS